MIYQRLSETTIPNPSSEAEEKESNNEDKAFTLKILCTEKSYQLGGLNPKSTIANLKAAAEEVVGVTVDRQRLILNGKLLQQDDKTLESYGVENGAIIHLFPRNAPSKSLPVASPAVSATATATPLVADNVNPMHEQNQLPLASYPTTTPAPAASNRYEPRDVARSTHEVKLWSYLLLMTSAFRLFGIMSAFAATGAFGVNALDSIVQFAELICSAIGLYVGRLGVMSAQTMDLFIIKRYVSLLLMLAVMAIIVRVTWVADVVLLADQARRDQSNGGG
eukprot:CAMPEP_0182425396 /NCGR_PEP_ID=MMETSP1167-20130531/11832_1 /TAXON_ID=2988 /ORGANISM="Mallomonas Sp, Strain CCMP3275" /LENGTH=277 /DNA_ID=CAMNT_0024606095 /DNA_START=189 /DNA_END=1018 /DNA_ORIENTATION=+